MPALVDPGISSKRINMQGVYRQQQNDIDICDMHIILYIYIYVSKLS